MLRASLWVLLLGLLATAWGQELPGDTTSVGTPGGTVAPDTIVVTARLRQDQLFTLPGAVSVVGAQELEQSRIDSARRLVLRVPSLHYLHPGSPAEVPLLIRGIGNYGTGEPAVGYFVDGAYFGGRHVRSEPLYDLERVEVLRGPQNSLFGKSTVAGALHLITADPSFEPSVHVQGSAETPGRYGTTGAFSGPISESMAARVAWFSEDFGGYYKNHVRGRPVDGHSTRAARIKLLALPTDGLELLPSFSFRRTHADAFAHFPALDDDDYSTLQDMRDKRNFSYVETWAGSLTARIDLPRGYELVSVSGLNRSLLHQAGDVDYTSAPPDAVNPFANLFAQRRTDENEVSQELRLLSPQRGVLSWQLGAFAYHARKKLHQRLEIDSLLPIPPVAPTQTLASSQTYSLFGQLSLRPIERLELTAELRYDHDRRRFWEQVPGGRERQGRRFDSLSPRFSIGLRPIDELFLYVSTALGFRPGGFNEGGASGFDKERTFSAEVGARTSWLDGRIAAGFTVFYAEIDDQQVFELDPGSLSSITTNKGEARSFGIEVETRLVPFEGFTLFAGATWIDAEFTDYEALDIAPDGMMGVFDFKGKTLQWVPEYQLALAAEYRHPLSEEVEAGLRADFRSQGLMYWDTFNSARQEPYHVLDLAAFVQFKLLTVTAYINNVFDEGYFTDFSPAYRFPPFNLGVIGEPQSVGMSLSYRF